MQAMDIETKTTPEERAQAFLIATDTAMDIRFKDYGPYFPGDKESRNIYTFTLTRKGKSYTDTFGDSIRNTEDGNEPTEFDILACLSVTYSTSFDEFCSEFGYSNDSMSAHKTWKAVLRQSNALKRMFNEQELEQLQSLDS